MVIMGKGFAGGEDWEFAHSRCKLLHSERINNKGTRFNILGETAMERNIKNAYMCKSLFCIAEINTVSQLYVNKKFLKRVVINNDHIH